MTHVKYNSKIRKNKEHLSRKRRKQTSKSVLCKYNAKLLSLFNDEIWYYISYMCRGGTIITMEIILYDMCIHIILCYWDVCSHCDVCRNGRNGRHWKTKSVPMTLIMSVKYHKYVDFMLHSIVKNVAMSRRNCFQLGNCSCYIRSQFQRNSFFNNKKNIYTDGVRYCTENRLVSTIHKNLQYSHLFWCLLNSIK